MTPDQMAPLCFIDTKTTGVHPGREVWEIGGVRRDEDGAQVFQFYVDVDLTDADPRSLAVGRFYERHPMGQFLSGRRRDLPAPDMDALTGPHLDIDPDTLLTREDAAHVVARMTHGAHLVGAVPSFDAEVLDRLLRFWNIGPAWHYHLIDAETLAVGFLHHVAVHYPNGEAAAFVQRPLPWNSDDLTTALGLTPPDEQARHTALGDAYWAMAIYDTVMAAGVM